MAENFAGRRKSSIKKSTDNILVNAYNFRAPAKIFYHLKLVTSM